MNKVIINSTAIVFVENENGIFTDSRTIANVFEKEHKNVMQAIRDIDDLSEIISELKIQPSDYKDLRGKIQKMYNLDRDMFTELVVGFAGSRVRKWKREYIEAFDAMEKELLNIQKLTPLQLVTKAYELEESNHRET